MTYSPNTANPKSRPSESDGSGMIWLILPPRPPKTPPNAPSNNQQKSTQPSPRPPPHTKTPPQKKHGIASKPTPQKDHPPPQNSTTCNNFHKTKPTNPHLNPPHLPTPQTQTNLPSKPSHTNLPKQLQPKTKHPHILPLAEQENHPSTQLKESTTRYNTPCSSTKKEATDPQPPTPHQTNNEPQPNPQHRASSRPRKSTQSTRAKVKPTTTPLPPHTQPNHPNISHPPPSSLGFSQGVFRPEAPSPPPPTPPPPPPPLKPTNLPLTRSRVRSHVKWIAAHYAPRPPRNERRSPCRRSRSASACVRRRSTRCSRLTRSRISATATASSFPAPPMSIGKPP